MSSSPLMAGARKNAAECNQLQRQTAEKEEQRSGGFLWGSSVFAAIKCKYISSRQVGHRTRQDTAATQAGQSWVEIKDR